MNLREAIGMAFSSLRSNKLRSLLTLLGVIIGISAVTAILGLGAGLQKQTMDTLEGGGINDLMVAVAAKDDDTGDNGEGTYYGPERQFDDASLLTPEKLEQLRQAFPNQIQMFSLGDGITLPGQLSVEQLAAGNLDASASANNSAPSAKSTKVNLRGVNPEAMVMAGDSAAYGRLLTEADINGERNVVVISPTVVDNLFGGNASKALGATVSFNGEVESSFVVVGITAKREGSLLAGQGNDAMAIVPYTTLNTLRDKPATFEMASLRISATADRDTVKQEITDYLDKQWADDPEAKMKVTDFSSMVAQFKSVMNKISLVISLIAGISLLVGGIGIMNIMLVSVTERTKEIGTRKALGATRRAIRTQFVIEAMIICLIGGTIGVLLGTSFSLLGGMMLKTVALPPLWGVLGSLLFSVGIGLFFGYYPANKAAKMNPIEALRHE